MAYGQTPTASLLERVRGSLLQLQPFRLASGASSTFAQFGLYNLYSTGGMAEWLKAAVLKTVECNSSVGSNPTPSAIFLNTRIDCLTICR